MTETTRERALRLAKEAGFRVFGDKVVAADDGVSGRATDSIETLIRLATNEALERAAIAAWISGMDYAKTSGLMVNVADPREVGSSVAAAIRAMKEE